MMLIKQKHEGMGSRGVVTWLLAMAMILTVSGVSSAEIIEDFETYTNGEQLSTTPGVVGSELFPWTHVGTGISDVLRASTQGQHVISGDVSGIAELVWPNFQNTAVITFDFDPAKSLAGFKGISVKMRSSVADTQTSVHLSFGNHLSISAAELETIQPLSDELKTYKFLFNDDLINNPPDAARLGLRFTLDVPNPNSVDFYVENVFLDDFELFVPEPVSAWFLSGGMLLLAMRRRMG